MKSTVRNPKNRSNLLDDMSAITITREPPDSPDAQSLIAELDTLLEPLYPTRSRHGYTVAKLIDRQVHFFLIRHNGTPAGCGGIQFFGSEYGEIKRMYVRPEFRGLGLGRQMLNHLERYAQQHDINVLRLETGIHQHEAIALYEQFGFQRIPPFGEYFQDPVSRCYEKRVASKTESH